MYIAYKLLKFKPYKLKMLAKIWYNIQYTYKSEGITGYIAMYIQP